MSRIAIALVTGLILLGANLSLAKSANSYLRDIREKYDEVETIKMHFKEVFEWSLTGEKTFREGEMIVGEGDKFKFDTAEQLIISDGTTVHRHNLLKNQIMLESVSESNQRMLPRRMMIKFAEEFEAESKTLLQVTGKSGYRLDLIPEKSDELMISGAAIWFTEEDLIVHRIKFTDLNGNSTDYYFSNIKFNETFPKETWEFPIPDNAEIFDLRH